MFKADHLVKDRLYQLINIENHSSLELNVQQLERELLLLKQKANQRETEIIWFKRYPSPVSPSIASTKKENNRNSHQETKKRTRGLCQQQRPRRNFNNPNSKFFLPNHGIMFWNFWKDNWNNESMPSRLFEKFNLSVKIFPYKVSI